MTEPMAVRIYADVLMPYEDFLGLDDEELTEYVMCNWQGMRWEKEGISE